MAFGFGFWGIIMLIAAVWVIYDVMVNQKKFSDAEKLVWIVLAIVLNVLTAIVYYFLKKR